jgi:hypothetical protein
MAEAAKPETKTTVEALSPARFMESQRHNTALFTEANELLTSRQYRRHLAL